jgi:predicted RNase H-like nuclease
MLIVGIDLAWGEHNRDGICLIEASSRRAFVRAIAHTLGDEALLSWLSKRTDSAPVILMVDAPIVCPNTSGSRPVDKLTHRLFGQFHAGCYPANSTRCSRPARLCKLLVDAGYTVGWKLDTAHRLVCEVYPHPAMIRLFGLARIVKYKRGPVAKQRREFRKLQRLLIRCLANEFPRLELSAEAKELLVSRWTKPVEDKADALFCALIGYHHYIYQGRQSEVLGDLNTGFILVPKPRVGRGEFNAALAG